MEKLASSINIYVFLASPDDLGAERLGAREVIQELNESLCRLLGVQIVPLLWEDTPPAAGRPQDFINPYLDICDLFVGLLWMKWGTPTGDHSSGFMEEFDRAKRRRMDNGSPEIWICFKRIPADRLSDIGPQLSRVIAFRDAIRAQQDISYREFGETADWIKRFRTWLTEFVYIYARRSGLPSPSPQATISVEASSQYASATSQPSQGQPNPLQIVDASAHLHEALRSTRFEQLMEDSERISQLEAARLYLATFTLLAGRHTSSLLGSHEANFLYRFRRDLELTSPESFQVTRSLVADEYNIIPAWYWLRTGSPDQLITTLINLATRDSRSETRRGAISLLSTASFQLPETGRADFLGSIFLDDSREVRQAAVLYAQNLGDAEDIQLLESLATREPERAAEARQAVLVLKARQDPNATLERIVRGRIPVSTETAELLNAKSSELSTNALVDAARHPDPDVRLLAARILAKRGELDPGFADSLSIDASPQVREIAVRSMIDGGRDLTPEVIRGKLDTSERRQPLLFPDIFRPRVDTEGVLLQFYRHQSEEYLRSKILWGTPDGPIAYEALVTDHFASNAARIRSDLDEQFQSLKAQALEAIRQLPGEGPRKLAELLTDIEPGILSRFVAAALSGLVLHGDATDVTRARQHIRNDSEIVVRRAIEIFDRFGGESDAGVLLEIARTSYEELKMKAAGVALKLKHGRVADELLQTDDAELVGLALGSLLSEEPDQVIPRLELLLDSDRLEVRKKAIAYLINRFPPDELEGILDYYMGKPTYYYHVVASLDKAIYAPESLRRGILLPLAEDI